MLKNHQKKLKIINEGAWQTVKGPPWSKDVFYAPIRYEQYLKLRSWKTKWKRNKNENKYNEILVEVKESAA